MNCDVGGEGAGDRGDADDGVGRWNIKKKLVKEKEKKRGEEKG